MPVLSKRIVLDCFYLLIFYFEKFSTDVCRLPCAVNVNLNLSIVLGYVETNTDIFETTLLHKSAFCSHTEAKGGWTRSEMHLGR